LVGWLAVAGVPAFAKSSSSIPSGSSNIHHDDPGNIDSCEAYDEYEYGSWQTNYVLRWRAVAEGVCIAGAAAGTTASAVKIRSTPHLALAEAIAAVTIWACTAIDIEYTSVEGIYVPQGEKRKVWHRWGERLPSGQCRINQESWWEYRY